jgi:hypothetical protein
MISNIHKTVIRELKDKRPRNQILNDLIVSFCALSLNELRCSEEPVRKAMLNYVTKQLEFSFRLVQNYQDFFNDDDIEKLLPDFPDYLDMEQIKKRNMSF